jgi:hypothetical protein
MAVVRRAPANMPQPEKGARGTEVQRRFVPTPEAISQYLENMKAEEIAQLLASVERRREVYDRIMEHEEDIREFDPDFDPELLREQLDLVGETLQQKKRFQEEMKSPEKKGLMRRAWERVKGFAKRHPIVSTLLVLALAASGVAVGFYLTGNWELLMTRVGVEKILGGAKAAEELIPPTLPTPQLPGGGVFEIPPPTSPPDLGTPL